MMKWTSASLGVAAIIVWAMVDLLAGQVPEQAALVIEGGTLIDGNGGTSVPDVQIVIRGNRIAAIDRRGAPIPKAPESCRPTANSSFPAYGTHS